MDDKPVETRRVPPFVIVAVAVIALLGLAYWGHQQAVAHTVNNFYANLLAKPPAQRKDTETEAERYNRCQSILMLWTLLDEPTLDFEAVAADLPLPLRITHTFHADNPEDLRKRAAAIFVRDLEQLSARKTVVPTPNAWKSELAQWQAGLRP